MASYKDTKQKIKDALTERPVGTEIQPELHEDYALNMLDYIRGVELISTSTLMGVANENTFPVESNSGKVCYISGISADKTVIFNNFYGEDGEPIFISTSEFESVFVILYWNTEFWSAYSFNLNMINDITEIISV